MPCSDNGESEHILREITKREEAREHEFYTHLNFSTQNPLSLLKRINYLEAIVCALTKECNDNIICKAERNGKVEIFDFIYQHEKDDKQRIKSILYSAFSNHELKLIKKVLNEQDDNL